MVSQDRLGPGGIVFHAENCSILLLCARAINVIRSADTAGSVLHDYYLASMHSLWCRMAR